MRNDERIRNPSFDVLRIVSILMIIAFHYVFHGGAGLNSENNGIRFASEVIYHFGELGVSCFFLISGYFLENTVSKPKKFALILLQIEFYIVISKFILILFGQSTQWEARDFFPFLSNGYWFIHVYLLIYLLQPFLKQLLLSMEKNQLWKLIMIQIVIWSLVPTLVYSTFFRGSTENMPYYNRYIWFFVVYLLGCFLRYSDIPIPKIDILHLAETKTWIKLIFPFELLILFIITGERGLWPFSATFFWTPNSFLMVMMSVAMLSAFKNWKPKMKARWVSTVASTTLGIYLLHDGELRPFIWNSLFPYHDTSSLIEYFGRVIVIVLCIFVVGSVIEMLRQSIEKAFVFPVFQLIEKRIEQKG